MIDDDWDSSFNTSIQDLPKVSNPKCNVIKDSIKNFNLNFNIETNHNQEHDLSYDRSYTTDFLDKDLKNQLKIGDANSKKNKNKKKKKSNKIEEIDNTQSDKLIWDEENINQCSVSSKLQVPRSKHEKLVMDDETE